MNSIRDESYKLVKKVYCENAYSNIALNSVLKNKQLSDKEKSVISRIFYGVVERKLTLEYIISHYSNKPVSKLDKEVVITLLIALYQLKYMDSVPDNVVVNESVTFVKEKHKSSASGFVNALLRNFIRDNKQVVISGSESFKLSVEYSCNEEIVKLLMSQYSKEKVIELLSASLEPSAVTVRVNTLKISSNELIKKFEQYGITPTQNKFISDCLDIKNTGSLEECELFREGYFHVQDFSSQLCCKALGAIKGQNVLDICSAPGGKTFTIAEMTEDSCNITACDLHLKRVELIKQGCERLGIKSVTAFPNDAKVYNDNLGQFDRILCDVPCSGLGVIRSKPEIKYKNISDIKNLPQIQYDILKTASSYLKIGGELVYSTCTVNKEENDKITDRFLNENENFCKVDIGEETGIRDCTYKATIFPTDFNSDGFYISKIKRLR